PRYLKVLQLLSDIRMQPLLVHIPNLEKRSERSITNGFMTDWCPSLSTLFLTLGRPSAVAPHVARYGKLAGGDLHH
ncbi:hypothetical protein, partial [Marinobacter xestospongiae]